MPRRAASGPALDKLKKLMSSSLGKRASRILQEPDDPVELVTRAAEQAVDEGLVEADSIDIPSIFSPQKDSKGRTRERGREKRRGSGVWAIFSTKALLGKCRLWTWRG